MVREVGIFFFQEMGFKRWILCCQTMQPPSLPCCPLSSIHCGPPYLTDYMLLLRSPRLFPCACGWPNQTLAFQLFDLLISSATHCHDHHFDLVLDYNHITPKSHLLCPSISATLALYPLNCWTLLTTLILLSKHCSKTQPDSMVHQSKYSFMNTHWLS